MVSTTEIGVRLAVALLSSGAVGLQRSLTGKVAGMRTHILVGLGAAIFTVVSVQAGAAGNATTDRIAAQVVSGVGFIAGGVILKDHLNIRGLTTAAGLWAVAALGMAAGAGLYPLTVLGTLAVLLTLVLLRLLEVHFPRRVYATWELKATFASVVRSRDIAEVLTKKCHHVRLIGASSDEGTVLCFEIEINHHTPPDALTDTILSLGAQTVSWQVKGVAEEE